MLSILGLTLNTLGAFLVLIPDIPRLFRFAHNFPPLNTIEEAEKQLYYEEELTPEHPGFERIADAYFSYSPPFSDTTRLDELEGNSVQARLGSAKIEFSGHGYSVRRIVKEDDKSIFESRYTIELSNEANDKLRDHLAQYGIKAPNPYIAAETPKGRVPEIVEKYKRRVIFRMGAALLLAGFCLQTIDRLLI